jgi:hypothetical protein
MIDNKESTSLAVNPHIGARKYIQGSFLDAAYHDFNHFIEPKPSTINFENIVEQAFTIGIKKAPEQAKAFLTMVESYVDGVAHHLDENPFIVFDKIVDYSYATRLTPTTMARLAAGQINTLIHAPDTSKTTRDIEKRLSYPVKLMQFIHLFALSGDTAKFDHLSAYAEKKGKTAQLHRAILDISHRDQNISGLGLESLNSLIEEFNWNTHADEVNSKYSSKHKDEHIQ